MSKNVISSDAQKTTLLKFAQKWYHNKTPEEIFGWSTSGHEEEYDDAIVDACNLTYPTVKEALLQMDSLTLENLYKVAETQTNDEEVLEHLKDNLDLIFANSLHVRPSWKNSLKNDKNSKIQRF